MNDEKAQLAASFDSAAELYDRARPSYPDAAVDWLLPADARLVLDLGAGTGKLTRSVVDRGIDCVVVDPSVNMLAQLSRVLPRVRTLQGTAEQIPLADAAVDTVLVAQAWHWVDAERAVPEVARVLRPGGTLGLIWNVRDDRIDWVATLMGIIGEGGSSEMLDDAPLPGPPFSEAEQYVVEWFRPMDRRDILDLVASRSNFIVADEDQRRTTITEVNELLDSTGRQRFDMPYRTVAFRMRRD